MLALKPFFFLLPSCLSSWQALSHLSCTSPLSPTLSYPSSSLTLTVPVCLPYILHLSFPCFLPSPFVPILQSPLFLPLQLLLFVALSFFLSCSLVLLTPLPLSPTPEPLSYHSSSLFPCLLPLLVPFHPPSPPFSLHCTDLLS